MSRTQKSTGPVLEAPLVVLEQQRAELAQWTIRVREAQQRLDELDRTAGDDVLADPSLLDTIARDTADARSRIEHSGRAFEALEVRVRAAEVAFLNWEADRLQAEEVEPAEAAWSSHEVKVADLHRQLAELEGDTYVPVHSSDPEVMGAFIKFEVEPGQMSMTLRLARAVLVARARHRVIELMALGEDPTPFVTVVTIHGGDREVLYPESVWGPDAVVAAPEYAGRVQHARDQVVDIERAERELLDEAEWLEDNRRPPLRLAGAIFETVAEIEAGIMRRRQRAAELVPEAQALRAQIGALAGEA